MPRCIPTIPNDDESFVPRIEQPCLHARSTLKILDYPFHPVLSLFLYFSPSNIRNLSPSLSIPFDNRSPEKDFHIFPRTNIHFLSFSRVSNTRCISAVILITRHGFKFKIELVAFIFVRESISCFFLFFIREKN